MGVCTSLGTVLEVCNFIRKRLQHMYFPVNIPEVLGTAFLYRTTPGDAFALSFSIRKEFQKKLLKRLPVL